jgi:TatD DNase family protein
LALGQRYHKPVSFLPAQMFDTHAHLDDRKFDPDREQVIQQCLQNGVEYIVNIGTDLKSCQFSIELTQKHPQIYCAIAVHPHDSRHVNQQAIAELEKLAQNKKVVAIGEIGLDYYRMLSAKEDQIRAFKAQIELAFKLNLPIVYHVREAFDDTWKIILETKAYQLGGIMHSFSGAIEQAKKVTDLGLHISFNGSLTYKNSLAQKVLPSVPEDLILVETDCPYLTPEPYRGKRNQPDYVKYVISKMAEILQKSPPEVEQLTTRNALQAYRLKD